MGTRHNKSGYKDTRKSDELLEVFLAKAGKMNLSVTKMSALVGLSVHTIERWAGRNSHLPIKYHVMMEEKLSQLCN